MFKSAHINHIINNHDECLVCFHEYFSVHKKKKKKHFPDIAQGCLLDVGGKFPSFHGGVLSQVATIYAVN
jgi:hypothetical protein